MYIVWFVYDDDNQCDPLYYSNLSIITTCENTLNKSLLYDNKCHSNNSLSRTAHTTNTDTYIPKYSLFDTEIKHERKFSN